MKLFIYPMTMQSFCNYQKMRGLEDTGEQICETQNGIPVITANTFCPEKHLQTLYNYLKENGFLEPLAGFDPKCLDIFSQNIVCKIKEGDDSWELEVPSEVVTMIKDRKLWGCSG